MVEPKTVIFIGPQGSGKGTQAAELKRTLEGLNGDHSVIELETGKHFRGLMEGGTYTAERIKETLDEGHMLPNFFAKHIVLEDLTPQLTPEAHLILDGFPRNLVQVKFIDDLMAFYKRKELAVVYLNVAESVVLERLLARGRFDDTPELIAERLRLYHEVTEPVIDAYRTRDDVTFIEVDGADDIATIAANINGVLGLTN